MMKKLLLPLLLCASLSGCAVWSKVDKPAYAAPDKSYSVDLPVGWKRHHLGRSDSEVFITNDGPNINQIEINRRDNKDAFPKIKKDASGDMLALELAQRMIAEIKADEAMSNLEVIANLPAMVANRPGFELELRVKNNKGVEFEMLVYGTADDKRFYTLRYIAPQPHYFPRYRETFEQVVQSFRIQ